MVGSSMGGSSSSSSRSRGSAFNWPVFIFTCALFGYVFVSLVVLAFQSRYSTMLVFLLRMEGGAATVPALDRLLVSARFDSPKRRDAVLKTLIDICSVAGVADFYRLCVPRIRSAPGKKSAPGVWAEEQMAIAGIHWGPPGEQVSGTPKPRVSPEDQCVLGVVASVNGACIGIGNAAVPRADVPFASHLEWLRRASTESLHLYYAPDPGAPLSEAQACELFQRLRADADRRQSETSGPAGQKLGSSA
jgi:hypothetical protein